jgi:hypothetical protein
MSTLSVDTIQGKTTAGTVAMPSGHVIQVQRGEYRTYTNTTSTSYVASGLSVNITPKFTSSSILVRVIINGSYINANAKYSSFGLYRGSSNIANLSTSGGYVADFSDEPSYGTYSNVYEHIDSPSSTSQQTYALYMATSGGTLFLNNYNVGSTSSLTTITAVEIAQ